MTVLHVCKRVLKLVQGALNICMPVLRRVQKGLERLQDGFAS